MSTLALSDRIARFVWRVGDRAERAYVERCLITKPRWA